MEKGPKDTKHYESEKAKRETEPIYFGENVYMIPLVSDTAAAQELATIKLKLKESNCGVTAMTVIGDKLLVNFQENPQEK